MKVIRSVVFLTAWLCISVWFLARFDSLDETFYVYVWGFMAGFAVIDLILAVQIHGGKYKTIQLESCASTAIVAITSAYAYQHYSQGKYLFVLCWLTLAVVNIWLVYNQRKRFKAAVEAEGQDNTIKLERK